MAENRLTRKSSDLIEALFLEGVPIQVIARAFEKHPTSIASVLKQRSLETPNMHQGKIQQFRWKEFLGSRISIWEFSSRLLKQGVPLTKIATALNYSEAYVKSAINHAGFSTKGYIIKEKTIKKDKERIQQFNFDGIETQPEESVGA